MTITHVDVSGDDARDRPSSIWSAHPVCDETISFHVTSIWKEVVRPIASHRLEIGLELETRSSRAPDVNPNLAGGGNILMALVANAACRKLGFGPLDSKPAQALSLFFYVRQMPLYRYTLPDCRLNASRLQECHRMAPSRRPPLGEIDNQFPPFLAR